MTREAVFERLNEVFRDVFDDEQISVNDATTAEDVESWDSLMHITLISEMENAFGIQFAIKDIHAMKTVGEMADRILELQHR